MVNKNEDFNALLKKYNEEMLKYKSIYKPKIVPDVVVAEKEDNQEVMSLQNEQAVESDKRIVIDENLNENVVAIDNSYIPKKSEESVVVPAKNSRLDGTGFLQIQVFTARSATPIKGAYVAVTAQDENNEYLIFSTETDENGETEITPLKAVSSKLLQQPDIINASYNIKVASKGYFTVKNLNVTIFDNETSIHTVEMIPLPENYKDN